MESRSWLFEHVGPLNYRSFFKHSRPLLSVEGVMLLHTIGRADWTGAHGSLAYAPHIPGGYVLALSQIASAIEDARLWITDMEVLRLHYAQTLLHWYQRVISSRE